MTKIELIKKLEKYPDDIIVCIWDTELEIIDPIDYITNHCIGKYESNTELKGRVLLLANKETLEYHNIL